MSSTNYTPQEIAAQGEEIYDEFLRDRVESEHRNRFLVLDIESRDFEIADDDLTATKRILARRPHGVLYGIRIGHVAAYRIGRHLAAG
jgi:hypothetical protein